MAITMKRVADLIEKDSDYDESFIKPNEESYSLVRRVLENLKQYFPAEICNASPAAIGDGGIFIEWGSADNYVRLIVPPDPRQAYLYCRSGSEKKTTREVSSATLAEFLEWMIRHERSRAEKE